MSRKWEFWELISSALRATGGMSAEYIRKKDYSPHSWNVNQKEAILEAGRSIDYLRSHCSSSQVQRCWIRIKNRGELSAREESREPYTDSIELQMEENLASCANRTQRIQVGREKWVKDDEISSAACLTELTPGGFQSRDGFYHPPLQRQS